MVEPAEIGERGGVFTEQALPSAAERIEQPHFHVRERVGRLPEQLHPFLDGEEGGLFGVNAHADDEPFV